MVGLWAATWDRLRFMHRAWRYRLRVERAEVLFLLDQLKSGQTAIDIGAHRGAFTYWMNSRVGRGGKVLAFEPIPLLAAYLRHIQTTFPFPQMQLVESALSDAVGDRPIYLPCNDYLGTTSFRPEYHENGHTAVEVATRTLDQCSIISAARPIHFVKCDVEGHELEVLMGGERLLREDRPVLLLECEDHRNGGGQLARVVSYLDCLGYKAVFFPRGRGRMRPFSEFRMDADQPDSRRGSCVNFGFLPKEKAPEAKTLAA